MNFSAWCNRSFNNFHKIRQRLLILSKVLQSSVSALAIYAPVTILHNILPEKMESTVSYKNILPRGTFDGSSIKYTAWNATRQV